MKNATVKLSSATDYPVRFSHTEVEVTLKVTVNNYYEDVYGTYNLKTKEFTPNMIGVYSLGQYASDTGVDYNQLVRKIQRVFKQAFNNQ